jgi:amino acid transporter
MSLLSFLLGRPIPTSEARSQKIGVLTGIPVLGLDALASAAYGPEAALTIFVLAGTSGIRYVLFISGLIVGLLFVVQFSYRQTIAAYPNGGGSYTVATENLGTIPGLVAGAALLIDYILNVAVAISSGVGALVSAVPRLFPHTLALCLALLALLALVNLRGVRAASAAFTLPTYAFVAALGGTLVLAGVRAFHSGGHPHPVEPVPVPPIASAASLWLLTRAFASGCTALTGIEAVSNGVPLFREPSVQRAQRTLLSIASILGLLLIGVALACRAYHISATLPGRHGYQSVLSQIFVAVAGRGVFYYFAIGSVIAVLCLSANTSFADFPRVCRLLALDEFLPESFAHQGRRLVYSHGIVLLTTLAGLLLFAFRGITDRLIPLFAVGAFTAFTMSQAGMVAHWARSKEAGARRSMLINAAGAAGTGLATVIMVASKFVEGAWISIGSIVGFVLLLLAIRAHLEAIARATADEAPLETTGLEQPITVVPIKRLDLVCRKALRFALSISNDVRAVQVKAASEHAEDLRACWAEQVEKPVEQAGLRPPRLVVLPSTCRELIEPLLQYVRRLAGEHPGRSIAVVVPDLVERRWYHSVLHGHVAREMEIMLLLRGGPRVVVVAAPWHTTEKADWSRARKRRSRARRSGGKPRGRRRESTPPTPDPEVPAAPPNE